MEFEPQSEKDIKAKMMLAPGVYDFEIIKAEEKKSSKGNPMIVLDLKVFPTDGSQPRFVRDYLVSSMELKLNRFCRAAGLEDAYNEGALTAFACEGAAGKVKLTIEASDQYGDKNAVKDYVVPGSSKSDETPEEAPAERKPAPEKMEQELIAKGDEIPF